VPLKCARALDIEMDRINVNGRLDRDGHPLRCHRLHHPRHRARPNSSACACLATAAATLCVGGGMGIATIIERV